MLFRSGWQACSQVKLEAVNSDIYINLADQTNALSTAFAALAAETDNTQEDVFWHLKALQIISHQYIKSQNWILAAKYLRELDNLALKSSHNEYFHDISLSLRSLMEMMQGNTAMALELIDSIPTLDKLQEQMPLSDAFAVSRRNLYYRGCLNGFGADYQGSTMDYLFLLALLNSDL